MGDSAPEKVKLKIVEMLYSWTVAFPGETKISEAYQTLKRQGAWRFLVPCLCEMIQGSQMNVALFDFEGLVMQDPELPLDRTLIPSPPTRPKHPVFDNEDMGKVRD